MSFQEKTDYELVASSHPPSPPKMTPLLEALKAEKIAQKDKEAIIRNHAHYKDILNVSPSSSLRKEEKRKTTRAEAATVKKAKKGSSVPPKAVQIQAQSSTGPSHGAGNTVSPLVKPQSLPTRQSRKHAAKASKEVIQIPPAVVSVPTPASKDTIVPVAPLKTFSTSVAPPKALFSAPVVPEEVMSNATAPARRGRPVLGLGSRHFEAALSGVGVTGERKRREKSRDPTPTPSLAAAGPLQESVSQTRPNPSSPPRRLRHQKEGSSSSGVAVPPVPDANGDSMLSVPVASHGDGGRGGRRRGRGRGGPSRIG